VVSEGRGSRAIMHGRHRMVAREGAARVVIQGGKRREADVELYDLAEDPGERHDLAARHPDLVAEMKARLEAALNNAPVAGGRARATSPPRAAGAAMAPAGQAEEPRPPVLHLRFAGG